MQLKKTVLIALAAGTLTLSGCAYRADLAQGNFVEQERVDLLRYGMSAEQVRYILGTPMLVDPFDNSRWYYVHYLRQGWHDPDIKNLIVLFSGSTLIDVSGDFKKPDAFMDSTTGEVTKIEGAVSTSDELGTIPPSASEAPQPAEISRPAALSEE